MLKDLTKELPDAFQLYPGYKWLPTTSETTQEELLVWLHSDHKDRNWDSQYKFRTAVTGHMAVARGYASPGSTARVRTSPASSTGRTPDFDRQREVCGRAQRQAGGRAGAFAYFRERWVHDLTYFNNLGLHADQENTFGGRRPLDPSSPVQVLTVASLLRRVLRRGATRLTRRPRNAARCGVAPRRTCDDGTVGLYFLGFCREQHRRVSAWRPSTARTGRRAARRSRTTRHPPPRVHSVVGEVSMLLFADVTAEDRRAQFRRSARQRPGLRHAQPFDRPLAVVRVRGARHDQCGFARSLGKHDVTRDELIEHVGKIAAATDLPLNADSERCYAEDAAGVAETVGLLTEAGAAGFSIEDYNPATSSIDDIVIGVGAGRPRRRSRGSRSVCRWCSPHCATTINGAADLDDTIARLIAYRDGGADVVAPGLADVTGIAASVKAVRVPVSVLALPKVLPSPSWARSACAGSRRVERSRVRPTERHDP